MNSIERLAATINFEKADRVPVIAQVFGHAAVFAGVPLHEYICNGEQLAKCQIKALEHYDYDSVFALADVNVEAEAMGCVLNYKENNYASIKNNAVTEKTDISKLELPNPEKAGRMPEILKAAKILRKEVGDERLVVGCVLGPFSIATQLLGIEKTLFLAIDDTDVFTQLLNFSADIAVSFGIAQIQSGAHLPVVFDPSASPAVIPQQFFKEFVFPTHEKVFSQFKEAGAIANWLHIAGPVDPILPYYPQTGVDIANIDFCIEPKDAIKLLPETCIDGNIKPLSFEYSNIEEITKASNNLLNQFSSRGGFILSSGCEIPPKSKPENIKAMVDAVKIN